MTEFKRGQPGMTVAKLIEELKKLPPDSTVIMTDYQYALHDVFGPCRTWKGDPDPRTHLCSDDEPNAGDL